MKHAVALWRASILGNALQQTRPGFFRACVIVGIGLLAVGGLLTSPRANLEAFATPALPVDVIEGSAPTVPGAPFLPIGDRTQHVVTRYETFVALDEISQAKATLSLRSASAIDSASTSAAQLQETHRILDAQTALLERTLEQLERNEQELTDETASFGVGLAVFPVDQVRKPFWNDWGRPRSGGRTHVGTDVLAQIGVPLRSIEDGVVEAISSGGNGGNGIFLIGDSGSRYYYAHMDEIAELAVGDRVLAGQPVGTVGDTGNARGAPHLHLQWDPNGGSAWQNPFPLLDVLFGQGRTAKFSEEADAQLAAISEGAAENQAELDLLVESDVAGDPLTESALQ